MAVGRIGRPPAKQTEIAEDLRQKIVSGSLAPDSRLPTRRELAELYAASLPTVQQALDALIEQGFVIPRGTLGTFVTPLPPHLANYAVVFSGIPGASGQPRFWSAMANEVLRFQQSDRIKVKPYIGIDGHTDNEDYQALLRQVERHSVAGIVFVHPPLNLDGTPVLDEPGIPRVAVSTPLPQYPNIHGIHLDARSLVEKALDFFVARGRKRVAVVAHSGLLAGAMGWPVMFAAAMEARNLESRPYWIQAPSATFPESAQNLVHLLLQGSPQERPDALLIADDNFVEHATAGIVAAGARVPDDLDVVAHCNFPWPTPAVLPVRRIGYDCGMVLRSCLNTIDRLRQGERMPAHFYLPAQFEDELSF